MPCVLKGERYIYWLLPLKQSKIDPGIWGFVAISCIPSFVNGGLNEKTHVVSGAIIFVVLIMLSGRATKMEETAMVWSVLRIPLHIFTNFVASATGRTSQKKTSTSLPIVDLPTPQYEMNYFGDDKDGEDDVDNIDDEDDDDNDEAENEIDFLGDLGRDDEFNLENSDTSEALVKVGNAVQIRRRKRL